MEGLFHSWQTFHAEHRYRRGLYEEGNAYALQPSRRSFVRAVRSAEPLAPGELFREKAKLARLRCPRAD